MAPIPLTGRVDTMMNFLATESYGKYIKVTAKINGNHNTIKMLNSQSEADIFLHKCHQYNAGVYDNEVFEALNSLKH